MSHHPSHPLLAGKLVHVTGAARGIGAAIATTFAASGARVIVSDLEAGSCDGVVSQITESGGEAWGYTLDVTDPDSISALAAQVGEELGDIDILVNNAGVMLRERIDSPDAAAAFRRTIDVNLVGTFEVSLAFAPALRRTRGCIINTSSGAGMQALPNAMGYSPSKAALIMLTKTLALDLARDGIRVNSVAPGVIETDMTEATRADPARLDAFMRRTPLGRMGQPSEIASAALFLASPLASYVDGVTLPVDGGFLAN